MAGSNWNGMVCRSVRFSDHQIGFYKNVTMLHIEITRFLLIYTWESCKDSLLWNLRTLKSGAINRWKRFTNIWLIVSRFDPYQYSADYNFWIWSLFWRSGETTRRGNHYWCYYTITLVASGYHYYCWIWWYPVSGLGKLIAMVCMLARYGLKLYILIDIFGHYTISSDQS